MKKKYVYVIGILSLFIALIIPNVIAPPLPETGPRWFTPNGSQGMAGTFNITFNSSINAGYWNATFYLINRSVGTGSSGYALLLGNYTNKSTSALLWTIQFTSTNYVDGNYTLNVTLHNATDQYTKSITTVFIDNGIPGTTYGTGSPSNNNIDNNATQRFSTAIDLSRQNCRFVFGSNNDTLVTPSSGVCAITIYDIPKGTYEYYWTSTDGLNTSTFSTRTMSVQDSTGGSGAVIYNQTLAQQQQTKGLLVIVGIIALFWILSKRK